MSPSSIGRTSLPNASVRPLISTVSSSLASGSGLGHTIHPASPPGTKLRAICMIWR
jgi:hypothetical protein